MTPTKTVKYIDAPFQFAFWEIDEVAPGLLLFGLGIVTKKMLLMLVIIYITTKAYQKYKQTARRGALLHWLYFHGFYNPGGRYTKGNYRLWVG